MRVSFWPKRNYAHTGAFDYAKRRSSQMLPKQLASEFGMIALSIIINIELEKAILHRHQCVCSKVCNYHVHGTRPPDDKRMMIKDKDC